MLRAENSKGSGLSPGLCAMTAIALLMLASCASVPWNPLSSQARNSNSSCPPPPEFHQVQRGDTLFRIGWNYCLRYQDIAFWNRLDSPDRILVGQRLRLWAPGSAIPPASRLAVNTTATAPRPVAAAATAAPKKEIYSKPSSSSAGKSWEWPSQGKVVSRFNPSVPGRNGIRISGSSGQTVKAASPGQIVYTGSSLPGYGTLIIVEHSGGLLSAYGYLGKLYVKEGDSVRKGQTIAELGAGSDNKPALHFEIRKNGQPVNPLRYLPS